MWIDKKTGKIHFGVADIELLATRMSLIPTDASMAELRTSAATTLRHLIDQD